ncbi:OsmC family protein [Beijerinckia indica]|uniref:OsmC family protein n=1 Tax=Beijerinckia indica subsp. indica (strain ATCC 9039 / DSM 1715 / NCIMB 8712) TaxID=395963 RepID=B2ICP9_BEII9|nr:OsmC family protein [Beijerinckia indica]ACB95323.1 OsmC family protein [Beijerinckia indica subsp. indica ATCC 9039]
MPEKVHRYEVRLRWSGNRGSGTASYGSYGRSHELHVPDKPAILGSADLAFRGEVDRWNPEELLVGSLSACHQLWYLHLCADAGIVVVAYEDQAEGLMIEDADGTGRFSQVVLRPCVTIARGSDSAQALKLHHEANAKCFIARSMNFPVLHEPTVSMTE